MGTDYKDMLWNQAKSKGLEKKLKADIEKAFSNFQEGLVEIALTMEIPTNQVIDTASSITTNILDYVNMEGLSPYLDED